MDCTPGLKLALGGIIAFLLSFSASVAMAEDLIAYRGVYDLQLENMTEKSGITGLTGRMVYEFSGSKCEGYTTQFRFITQVDMKEASSRMTDQQTTSFESADGHHFRFASKNYLDQEETKEIVGAAMLSSKGVEVKISRPEEETYKLKSAEFPIMHTRQIIKNALAGKHFFQARLFDASEDANALTETTVIIGKEKKGQPDRETRIMGSYGNDPAWPVTISYFNDNDSGDGLPVYRTSFLLYKNGITRDLFMDYGDFSLRGRLVHLDILNDKAAPAGCAK